MASTEVEEDACWFVLIRKERDSGCETAYLRILRRFRGLAGSIGRIAEELGHSLLRVGEVVANTKAFSLNNKKGN
jgi:hypothetical protein